MSAEVNKSSKSEEAELRDEVLNGPSSTYAEITSLICEVFLKIAVEYCHANMEYNVVNACLKGEFYNGTLTCRFPILRKEVTEDDFIFHNENKVNLVHRGPAWLLKRTLECELRLIRF